MRRSLLLLAVLALMSVSVAADTIYQITAEGRQRVIQRDAIVVEQDPDQVIYKHFDLPDRRVERVRLNQGSLPYSVEISSASDHQRIIKLWKEFGYTATVTDTSGETTRVYDAYIDYYPPRGRGSLLEAIPAVTSYSLELADGGADVAEFSKIDHVDFQNGTLTLTLRSGQSEKGKYLMPTTQPAEARFLGITDHYDPSSQDVFDFSLPLARIKEIRFEQ